MKTSLFFFTLLFTNSLIYAQPAALDPTFDPGDGFSSTVYSIELLNNGKMIVGGSFWEFNGVPVPRVTRLNPDGTLDPDFATGSGFDFTVYQTATLSDGKIMVCGAFNEFGDQPRKKIARLNSNGSLDPTFDPGVGFSNAVQSIAIQDDGKIIAGGTFTKYDNQDRLYIARLHSNATLDSTFDPGTGFNQYVYTVALQEDGKILAGGDFTDFNGTGVNRLARINADGSLDQSFNTGSGFNGTVWSISVQEDGKIVVGGSFTSYQGVTRNFIARLNTDGSLDNSFNPGTGFDSYVYSTSIDGNGKIVAGGTFNSSQGVQSYRIARLHPNGLHDVSFEPATGLDGLVITTAVQADGKVVAGGTFTNYFGVSRNQIIRLKEKDEVTSIGIVDQIPNVSLYPNPGHDWFYLEGVFTLPIVEILDVTGKTVASQIVDGNVVSFNLKHQPAGIYFVKVGDRVIKLIKQ